MNIEEAKKQIVVIVDSREKSCQHIISKLQKNGIQWESRKLNFGDYSFRIGEKSFENIVALERKSGLDELAGNFTAGRKRFKSEFERAIEAGAKVHLVIEDAKGKDKLKLRRIEEAKKDAGIEYVPSKTYRSKFKAASYIGTLGSWKTKYNLEIAFIRKVDFYNYMMDLFYKTIEQEYKEE